MLHSLEALLDSAEVRRKSLVLTERALPSAMAKLPRFSCRPTAYWPVTLDWAGPALGEFPSASATRMVSLGFGIEESLVLEPPRVDRLTQMRPFSPYMKKALFMFGPVGYKVGSGFGDVGQA